MMLFGEHVAQQAELLVRSEADRPRRCRFFVGYLAARLDTGEGLSSAEVEVLVGCLARVSGEGSEPETATALDEPHEPCPTPACAGHVETGGTTCSACWDAAHGCAL